MSDPSSPDAAGPGETPQGVPPAAFPPDDVFPGPATAPPEDVEAFGGGAALGATVRVVYTDTLPEGVYVVYRGGPPRLLVNEAWWRSARPVERIQALESLWARLQSIPPE